MLPANATLRNPGALWISIPKSQMILWRPAIILSADNHREQSVMFYEISALKSAHANAIKPRLLS
jgi:hypothetical protein